MQRTYDTTWQCGANNTQHVTGIHNNCTHCTTHVVPPLVSMQRRYDMHTSITITIYCITNCNRGMHVVPPLVGMYVTHTVVSLWYHLNVLIPSETINYFCCIGCRVIQICQNPVFNGLPLQLYFQTIVCYQKLLVLWCLEHFASGWKNVLKHSWSMSKSACAWHTKLGAGANAELHSMMTQRP